MRHNSLFASGVPAQDAGSIVDPIIDHNPAVIFSLVFLDLLPGKLLGRSGGLPANILDLILHGRLHPAALASARLNGMAEHQIGTVGIGVFLDLRPHDVPAIVHHTVTFSTRRDCRTSAYPSRFQDG